MLQVYQESSASESFSRCRHFVKSHLFQFDDSQITKWEWVLSLSSDLSPGQKLLNMVERDSRSN